MGKNMDHEYTGISIKNSHPGCMWSILHVLHCHRWHRVKKMLPHKRHAVGVENPERDINAAKASKMKEHIAAEMDNSLIEEKATEEISEEIGLTKRRGRHRIKALISEEMSKRRGRHRRSSSLTEQNSSHPAQTQQMYASSIHHLEPSNINPLAEVALDDENPKIVHQENKNSSVASALELDQLQSKVCETPVASSEKCDLCATMLAMNYLWQSQVGEHGKKPVENHMLLQDKLNKIKQDLLEQKLKYAKEPSKDFSLHESKQFLDALNMFNPSKELFLKILQDPSSPLAHNFHGRRAFNSKIGLTKSVSFPLAGSSGGRAVGPGKLKHKQESEPWAEGGGQLQVGSQAKKLAELESRGNTCEYSVPLIAEHRLDNIPRPHLVMSRSFDNSSPGSPHELKNRRENKMVIKRFKNLKQKIKHAIQESRKEGHRITMDSVLQKIPHGRKLSKDVKKKKDDLQKEPTMGICSNYSPKSSCESDQSISALGKSGLQQMKRTSSFNESLDRYCQLYESSFNREAKHHISERLKLRTEEIPSPVRNAQKSLGRVLSLPDLRSFSYLQSDGSPDATSMGTPSRTAVNNIVSRGSSRFDEQKTLGLPMGSENETPVDEPVESESQENSVKVDESYPLTKDDVASTSLTSDEAKSQVGQTLDILRNLTTGDSAFHSEHEICPTAGAAAKMAGPSPISVLDTEFQEDITSPAKFSISEDLGLKPSCLLFGGVESFTNKQHEAGMDSPTVAKSIAHLKVIETPIKQSDSDFPHFLVNAKDISEFNYVRDVLELSGFSRNEFLGTWHSAGQPVGPSVFDEVEGCFLPEPSSYENEEGGNCTHVLLFDLVNEILLEIHERSFTYWPMPPSSYSHICPMPVGYHVLEEVWANISWYLSCRTKVAPSLDDAVSQDLAKGDGWMNIQFDAECVGLELEDMIFDDLLDELIWT